MMLDPLPHGLKMGLTALLRPESFSHPFYAHAVALGPLLSLRRPYLAQSVAQEMTALDDHGSKWIHRQQ